MRTISKRELRNNIGLVLRQVEAGERLRITIDGRPVADLVPAVGGRRTFVSGTEVTRLLDGAPLDSAFPQELSAVTVSTLQEL